VEASELLIEQYRTVRQETLEALDQMQTINQWGLGSLGVTIGLGLVASQHSGTDGAVVLMGLVPILVTFGIIEMAVMAQRIVDARCYLRKLEKRLAAQVTETLPDFVGWERERAIGFRVATSGFPALAAMIGVAVGVGPVLGGKLLADEGRWTAFAIAETLDVIILATFTIWIVGVFQNIRDTNKENI
jgi:hypothetical protein